jgi:hypothetical protein
MVELDELNVPEFCRSSVGLEDIYTSIVPMPFQQLAKAVDHTGSVRRRRRCSANLGSIHRSWSNSFGRLHVYGELDS